MKTITYNPETHVLVPREPSEEMCDAATADSCWENMNPPPSTAYRSMLAAAPQPEPNHNWCAGCSPDNCSGCGAESGAHTTPQPGRVAELEAALREAKTALLGVLDNQDRGAEYWSCSGGVYEAVECNNAVKSINAALGEEK